MSDKKPKMIFIGGPLDGKLREGNAKPERSFTDSFGCIFRYKEFTTTVKDQDITGMALISLSPGDIVERIVHINKEENPDIPVVDIPADVLWGIAGPELSRRFGITPSEVLRLSYHLAGIRGYNFERRLGELLMFRSREHKPGLKRIYTTSPRVARSIEKWLTENSTT